MCRTVMFSLSFFNVYKFSASRAPIEFAVKGMVFEFRGEVTRTESEADILGKD